VQEDSLDPYLQQFVKCLLASADYDSFYKVMAREGKTYKIKRMLERRASKESPGDALDASAATAAHSSPKAEAKGSSRGDEDSGYKGGGSAKSEYVSPAKEVEPPSRDYK